MDHSVLKDAMFDFAESDNISETYWSLIEKTQEKDFPEFVQAMRLQDDTERERGRVIVFRSEDKFPSSETKETIHSSRQLKDYLDDIVKSQQSDSAKGTRHLYVLEDPGRNKIEILGSRLGIPPAFFRAHWMDPDSNSVIIDQLAQSLKFCQCFRLKYPQLHRIIRSTENKNYQLGSYSDQKSNLIRRLQHIDNERHFETSKHQLSFWSQKYQDQHPTFPTKLWAGESMFSNVMDYTSLN